MQIVVRIFMLDVRGGIGDGFVHESLNYHNLPETKMHERPKTICSCLTKHFCFLRNGVRTSNFQDDCLCERHSKGDRTSAMESVPRRPLEGIRRQQPCRSAASPIYGICRSPYARHSLPFSLRPTWVESLLAFRCRSVLNNGFTSFP